MKILEIRRHSIRGGLEGHLNQQGVSLARKVGQDIGPFSHVVTSTLPRAFDTAIAMGFAVDEQSPLLSTYGPAVERESPWPMSFAEYAFAATSRKATANYIEKLSEFYLSLIKKIEDGGSILAVNHGGIVEMSTIACLPDFNYSGWGGSVGYCEGARLFWEDKFIRADELRVQQ